jgi:hypothetical protein
VVVSCADRTAEPVLSSSAGFKHEIRHFPSHPNSYFTLPADRQKRGWPAAHDGSSIEQMQASLLPPWSRCLEWTLYQCELQPFGRLYPSGLRVDVVVVLARDFIEEAVLSLSADSSEKTRHFPSAFHPFPSLCILHSPSCLLIIEM